jgi:hypothetical protein
MLIVRTYFELGHVSMHMHGLLLQLQDVVTGEHRRHPRQRYMCGRLVQYTTRQGG